MKAVSLNLFVVIWAAFFANLAFAQDLLSHVIKMGISDVAATKQKAEAGDSSAQLSLGDILANNFKPADALSWYRKAAAQGSIEATSRLGEMLMFGRSGIPASQSVSPNPSEGIQWTFQAATNLNTKAFLNMSKAFQNGIGVNTNLVVAYAWLQLYAEREGIVGRVLLNQMALQLNSQSLQEAQIMAADFKNGHWPLISPRKIVEGDPRLKLKGIIFGGEKALATINGRTMAEGESADILLKTGNLVIKCIQIQKDSVLILIEGENEPRRLQLK
ncbi:MAG: tetratricopeptide repeat protein [Limisphaerales bacterium]